MNDLSSQSRLAKWNFYRTMTNENETGTCSLIGRASVSKTEDESSIPSELANYSHRIMLVEYLKEVKWR